MAFARSQFARDYYLSWDADTLPLSTIDFFINDNILFNPKKEYHENYFRTINKLLGLEKVYADSFISESMMFKVDIVEELLDRIDQVGNGVEDWIERIISACDFLDGEPSFSEFETYGTYCCHKYPGLYISRYLNTFREAGMICGREISETQLFDMSFDLDMASFEKRHSPFFPALSNLLWQLNHWHYVIKSLSFREIIEVIRTKFIG